MDDNERKQYQEERLKLKEVFRDEDVKHFPLIIKASTAGVLETLLKETDKHIKGIYRVNVIDYSVGPITEGDLSNAAQTGAVILGFDVAAAPTVVRSAEGQGVCIRQHKLIYKYVEDIENFVHDVKRELQEEAGAPPVEVLGSAQVAQLFKVKDVRSKSPKMVQVAGSRVVTGDLERKFKYRVVRGEKIIQDDLKLMSMKKLQVDVTRVEKGHECGLCLDNFDGELQIGDHIECYKEADEKITKFNRKPGVHQSY